MTGKYQVEIWRFKESGKYYDTVYFETNADHYFEVFDEVRNAIKNGEMKDYFTHVLTGNGHPAGGFPALIRVFD